MLKYFGTEYRIKNTVVKRKSFAIIENIYLFLVMAVALALKIHTYILAALEKWPVRLGSATKIKHPARNSLSVFHEAI